MISKVDYNLALVVYCKNKLETFDVLQIINQRLLVITYLNNASFLLFISV